MIARKPLACGFAWLGLLFGTALVPGPAWSDQVKAGQGKDLKMPPALLDLEGKKASPTFVAFSPDNKWFAYNAEGAIEVYDLQQRKGALRWAKDGEDGFVREAAFSPASDKLAVATGFYNPAVYLWDFHKDKEPRAFERPAVNQEGFAIRHLAFTPDGRFLVGAPVKLKGEDQGEVQVWDVATGKTVRRLGVSQAGGVTAFVLSSDGKTVLAEHRKVLKVHDPASATQRAAVRAWDLQSGKDLGPVGEPVEKLLAWKRGSILPGAYPPGSRLHEVGARGDGCRVRISPGGWIMAFARDAKESVLEVKQSATIIKGAGARNLVDLTTGKVLYPFPESVNAPYLNKTHALSPNNQWLAILGTVRGSLLLLDLSGFKAAALKPHEEMTGRELEHAWDELGSEVPLTAFQAVRRLAGRPAQAFALLNERLKPIAATEREKDRHNQMAALIALLHEDSLKGREKAQKGLSDFGDEARGALRMALAKNPDEDARRRLEKLAANMPAEIPPDAVTRRTLWAIELLERLGTPAAERLLVRLTGGAPWAWETLEARASLAQLKR